MDECKSLYDGEHSDPAARPPTAAHPAGKPQAMAIAALATGIDQFDGHENGATGETADSSFDGVYRCARAPGSGAHPQPPTPYEPRASQYMYVPREASPVRRQPSAPDALVAALTSTLFPSRLLS